ncbi:choice-of-anchor D domain-containing protein [Sorangium sp. So ce764]|uniref:Ig-like domain-containing protein n=1 Tax=Sorangium sp. So ce764 TaxID=3133320 RepID=UPI003F5EC695
MNNTPGGSDGFESMEADSHKETSAPLKSARIPCQAKAKPVVTARILEAPRATLVLRPSGEANATTVLHTISVSPPGGRFEWIVAGRGVVDWIGVPDATLVLSPLKVGAVEILMIYRVDGEQATDVIRVQVEGVPRMEVAEPEHFPGILVGERSAVQNIRVRNTGTAPLIVSAVSVTGDNENCFVLGPKPGPIDPGNDAAIGVTFVPEKPMGAKETSLVIQSNASVDPTAIRTLLGRAQERLIEVVCEGLRIPFADLFVKDVRASRFGEAKTFTIKNVGNAPLEARLTAPTFFPLGDDSPANMTLPAGKTVTVSLSFKPNDDDVGVHKDQLVIESNAQNEPHVAIDVTGELIHPVEITPTVDPIEATGWYDDASAEHCVVATLKLGMTEIPRRSEYAGKGRVTVVDGTIALFEDKECTRPVRPIDAEALRGGKTLYVKGGAAGAGRVRLTLDPSDSPRIEVKAPVDGAVEIKPVDVVVPLLELEYNVVLLDKDLAQHQTDAKILTAATRVEVALQESVKGAFKKGAYLRGANLSIYLDDKCTTLYDQKTALPYEELTKAEKKKLYLKSKVVGDVDLKLALEANNAPGFRITPEAEKKITVVALGLEMHAFAEAEPHAEAAMCDKDKVEPGRVVHEQDAGQYGRAKLLVKKPDAKLWDMGGDDYKVVVSVHADTGALALFRADTGGGGSQKVELSKADFNGGDVPLWAEGTSAGDAVRHARVDVGIDRDPAGLPKDVKRNGDWARITVVKITKVTPDTPNYKQKVNLTGVAADEGPKYKAKAHLSKALKDIKICFRVAGHQDNAFTLPKIWKPKNPDNPVSALSDADGIAEGEVELSGVHATYKSGYHKNIFRVVAYVAGDLIADDPKLDDAAPTRRKESQDIEIEAPAIACVCCGLNPGHSTGYPLSMADFYNDKDFEEPPTAVTTGEDFATLTGDVAARAGCTCAGAGATRLEPDAGCGRFTRPLRDAEYNEILARWGTVRHTWQGYLGIDTESNTIWAMRAAYLRRYYPTYDPNRRDNQRWVKDNVGYPSQAEVQEERQINHLVPKLAGGCPSGLYARRIVRANVEANGPLCPACRALDKRYGQTWAQRNRIAK